jgi:hypothetical protein
MSGGDTRQGGGLQWLIQHELVQQEIMNLRY